MVTGYTWIFETAQLIAFSGKNAVTASFSKDGVFCCDEAHAGRKQKETASLSVQTASLGVQTASFPVHGFCTTHKTAFFFDYGVFSLKNASGKNLCRLKIQVCSHAGHICCKHRVDSNPTPTGGSTAEDPVCVAPGPVKQVKNAAVRPGGAAGWRPVRGEGVGRPACPMGGPSAWGVGVQPATCLVRIACVSVGWRIGPWKQGDLRMKEQMWSNPMWGTMWRDCTTDRRMVTPTIRDPLADWFMAEVKSFGRPTGQLQHLYRFDSW